MNFTDFDIKEPRGWGGIGAELAKHARALRALFPVDTPTVKSAVLPDGTRHHGKGSGGGGGLRQLTTVREGHDAVECVSASGATVYVLKAPGFRSLGATTYSVKGLAYGLRAGAGPVAGFYEYKERFELAQYGAYANAFRVLRLVKTANATDIGGDYTNDALDIGAVVACIHPFYTAIAGDGTVTGTTLLAWPAGAVTLASAGLTVDAGGDVQAALVDVTPRAWDVANIFLNRVEIVADAGLNRHVAAFDTTGGSFL